MTLGICDNDKAFCSQLKAYLNEYFNKHNLKCPDIVTFHSGEDVLEYTGDIDIIFLDARMNGISGIYTGHELKKRNSKVIFIIITDTFDYLDNAFHFHAFRYLSKPLDKNRLFRNLKDALYVYNTYNQKMAVETKFEVHTINSSEIIMVEAIERRVIVHTIKNDYLSIHNMTYWWDMLNHMPFFQSHRSYIINFEHVSHFDKSIIYLLEDKYKAYLTNRKYATFKNAYYSYLESTT